MLLALSIEVVPIVTATHGRIVIGYTIEFIRDTKKAFENPDGRRLCCENWKATRTSPEIGESCG